MFFKSKKVKNIVNLDESAYTICSDFDSFIEGIEDFPSKVSLLPHPKETLKLAFIIKIVSIQMVKKHFGLHAESRVEILKLISNYMTLSTFLADDLIEGSKGVLSGYEDLFSYIDNYKKGNGKLEQEILTEKMSAISEKQDISIKKNIVMFSEMLEYFTEMRVVNKIFSLNIENYIDEHEENYSKGMAKFRAEADKHPED